MGAQPQSTEAEKYIKLLLTFWSPPRTDLFWSAQRRPVEEEEAVQAHGTALCLIKTVGW